MARTPEETVENIKQSIFIHFVELQSVNLKKQGKAHA
jgi:hypothetical protein